MNVLRIKCPGAVGATLMGVGFDTSGYWSGPVRDVEIETTLQSIPKPYSYQLGDTAWIDVDEENFDTGAKRDMTGNRGRYELISHIFLKRLAVHLETGAVKYDARNWEKGIPLHRSFQSMIRHAYQWLSGDKTEDHLAAVACNVMFLIHTEDQIKAGVLPAELLKDMPKGYHDENQ